MNRSLEVFSAKKQETLRANVRCLFDRMSDVLLQYCSDPRSCSPANLHEWKRDETSISRSQYRTITVSLYRT